MNPFRELPRPLIIGHRGASADAPENTLAAFRLAVEQGVAAIELDAKLSADGQVVVMHDTSVDRTTDGHGRVSDLSLGQLKNLDAGSKFSARFCGEQIPTLEEVIEEVGQQLLIDIELTNYTTPADRLVQQVAAVINRMHCLNRVFFSSFSPVALVQVRRALPRAEVAILALKGCLGALSRSRFGNLFAPDVIAPQVDDVNENWLVKQRQVGRQVCTWTVNEAEQLRQLFAWGVDGIITDKPRLALQILEGR